MKLKSFFLAILLLSGLIFPQGKVFFDVKTEMKEKASLAHIKAALEVLIVNSGWASISEWAENYSLWLVNYEEDTSDPIQRSISFDIELRNPSLINKGKLLATDSIVVAFIPTKNNSLVENQLQLFKQKFGNYTNLILTEAFLAGKEIMFKLPGIIRSIDSPRR
ncbi:MAG: hypothetical protein K9I69_04215 [Ignavibacteriales bacterium]|nr:hypothetical protein [Ignavibacteriales bacterium]MCF8307038.1 hypothetical protein [Ignavibacteriales bacterium]MCF8316661.1 hypothetical protein [Ignavibacteriales bacterium]MCF8438317.1 hypothetical protein [Ignavibacteriales bacterium]